MSRQANPATVGAFVIGALALTVGGILFFGGGAFFKDTEKYVVYFEGSVNGLQLGSPVKLDGVEIGQVDHIRVIADLKEKLEAITETIIEIDRTRFERRGVDSLSRQERYQRMIDEGVRARLEMQSFITGQLYVALEVLPESEARLLAPPDAPYLEIPAVLTTTQEIERTVRSLIGRLQKLPLEEIVEKLDSTLAGIDRLVNDPKLSEAIANLDATLAEARRTAAAARVLIRDLDGRVDPIADSAVAALDQAKQTLESVETTLEPGSPLSYQLAQTLRELQEAARSLRVLADYLERNPNSLVFGRTAVEQ